MRGAPRGWIVRLLAAAVACRRAPPGSANIWDTDLFQDSNRPHAGVPTGPSPVVRAIHAAGHYSICYVEAGAYQQGSPDNAHFALGLRRSRRQGHADAGIRERVLVRPHGFRHYVPGRRGTLSGAATNIANALDKRFAWCRKGGAGRCQPDDLDGYTNKSTGGQTPWGMTRADAAGFKRWLAYDVHAHGLAVFQKNDGPTPRPTESTGRFCAADERAGIVGALFNVDLDGRTHEPCRP